MTTDYEKRYNEALERAREALNEIPLESYGARKIIIDAFPELAESDDERIRKHLVAIVELYWGKTNDPDKAKDLAWLKKQKENIEKEYVFRPLAGTDITIAAEQAIRRANEGDRLVLAFNGAYIPVRKGCNANKIVEIYDAFIEKQKEQKPAEWSEEDEKMRDRIIDILNRTFSVYSALGTSSTRPSCPTYKDEIDWLKSLRPSWKPTEDEERLINTSISFLKDFADKGYENAVECIDWLKSKLYEKSTDA